MTPAGGGEPAAPGPAAPSAPVRQAPGIGQHLGSLAHLSAHPRVRAWQRRALIAVIVMVVFTVLISWRLGLTLAVVAVIADVIFRSRQIFSPSSDLRHGMRVSRAQRRTKRQLSGLGRSGYQTLNFCAIPDSEEQIDHLVIGPAGVFSIDSEGWDRRLPVRTRNARHLFHGPVSMAERLEHAQWEAGRATELITRRLGSDVAVRPAMAVYGPRIPWDVVTISGVDVFSGPRLRKYLRRRGRASGAARLNRDRIEKITQAAAAAFPG